MDLMYVIVSSAQQVETFSHRAAGGNTIIEHLLEKYWTEYEKLTEEQFDVEQEQQQSLLAERMKLFKYAFLDYCRWLLGNRWTAKLDEDAAKRNSNNINHNLHNRSKKHICWLTQTIVQYLVELDLVEM